MTRVPRATRLVARQLVRGLTVVMLPAVHLSLARLGYQRTRQWLRRTSPEPQSTRRERARALQVGVTVNRGSRRAGWDNGCLRRSLVTWWLLRWLRIDSDVRFGLSPPSAGSLAHAWVEHDGEPVNDAVNIAAFFPFTHGGDLAAELGAVR